MTRATFFCSTGYWTWTLITKDANPICPAMQMFSFNTTLLRMNSDRYTETSIRRQSQNEKKTVLRSLKKKNSECPSEA